MRPDILPNENQIRNLIGEFELGRAAYKQQDWKKANKHFLACLSLKPEDGPSDLYLRRIEEMSSQPLVPDWDGVYVFTHK
jgi:adenylate cyclase